MKKVLALLLVLGMASAASATIIDVVTVDIGLSGGRTGAIDNKLMPSDIIGITIVLNYNENPWGATYPSYDGYLLSMMDLDLHTTGLGTLDTSYDKNLNPYITFDDRFGATYWEQDVTGDFVHITGPGPVTGIQSQPGGAVLVWDIVFHCDGEELDPVILDLTLAGTSQYSPLRAMSGGPYPDDWIFMTEADLGDLVIYQVPEPMTIALLGLGGLFLRRRK